LARRGWPGGVIGIVAGRLADRYAKPAILISLDTRGRGRASARSVSGCDIHAAIAQQADLLERFGGHPMAAGFAILEENLAEFRRRLNMTVGRMLREEPFVPELAVDAYVDLSDVSIELVNELAKLGPFGNGNPELALVAREVEIASSATIGRTREHRRLGVRDAGGSEHTVLQWHHSDSELPKGSFDLAYSAGVNVYRGVTGVQLVWMDGRSREPERVLKRERESVEVIDYRKVSNPDGVLRGVQDREQSFAVWAEGANRPECGVGRDRLEPASALAIWTAPPSATVFADALRRVAPERIYLFGLDPGVGGLDPFARRLLGLAKHAISRRGGEIGSTELAAAMASSVATVRVGLQWLAAGGKLGARSVGKVWYLEAGRGSPVRNPQGPKGLLALMIEEATAYREHFSTVASEGLLAGEQAGGSDEA
jgi:single-stranded-DNA-specific exonuclease